MKFDEPDVVEMGLADELIRDLPDPDNTEGAMQSKVKLLVAVYVADGE